jgi:hypothetical protein
MIPDKLITESNWPDFAAAARDTRSCQLKIELNREVYGPYLLKLHTEIVGGAFSSGLSPKDAIIGPDLTLRNVCHIDAMITDPAPYPSGFTLCGVQHMSYVERRVQERGLTHILVTIEYTQYERN